MQDKLKELKIKLSGLLYSRDIEDIVFDNGGSKKYQDPKKCIGRRIIDSYNVRANTWNNDQLKYFGRKTGLEKEIYDISDTRYFTTSYNHTPSNDTHRYITVYYFKEIIIIENVTGSLNPSYQYTGFRHYFTPDILLFLKHFNKAERIEQGMDFIRQNPHYFKHHTTDTHAIIKNIYDTIEEISIFNKENYDIKKSLEQRNLELEIENQNLKTKILELEKDKLDNESTSKLKIE
jgi:hypothetical protein